MKIQQLKAFVTVAGTLNFRRAAEILCITQPPLSHAIKALEEDIGVVLLDRKQKKNIRLTSAGESFLIAAQRILQDVERAKQTAQLVDQGDFGSLSIGYTDDFIYGNMPDLLNDFNLRYPNTSIYANQSESFRLINRLNHNEVDCIFTTHPLHKTLFDHKTVQWHSTSIVAIVPRHHPLAQRSEINLQELSQERFLMVAQDSRTRFDDKISKLLIGAGMMSHETMEIASTILCTEMVRRGYGVSLASLESIPRCSHEISILKLKDKGASLNLLMTWRPQNDNPSLDNFLEMALSK